MSFPFVVSVHDVAPATWDASADWVGELDRRGVPCTLLVIPGPYKDGPAAGEDAGLVGWLREAGGRGHELSLHGFHHARVPGGAVWRRAVNQVMARGAGEFCALPEPQARRLLRAGRDALDAAGIEVVGFTPPGWLASPGTRRALADLGFAYWTSHLALHDLTGGRSRRMPALSHRPGGAGERAGARLMVAAARTLARSRRPFRIALHPADLERPGLREAALDAVDLALAANGRPLTYRAMVGA
ncbi:DUF2334 domain-containing protein [Actinomadura vinacea]|uniref:DUF2334 domain-containing protein n=1 Tax=Actinomadura vinacea TaxID=115336 RepID=A0ABN3JN43_9ACTN